MGVGGFSFFLFFSFLISFFGFFIAVVSYPNRIFTRIWLDTVAAVS